MARILLRRVHQDIPAITLVVVTSAGSQTKDDALRVERIIAGIIPTDIRIVHPAIQGVLVESTMPLFIAGMQYENSAQRSWTVKAFEMIERCTGSKFSNKLLWLSDNFGSALIMWGEIGGCPRMHGLNHNIEQSLLLSSKSGDTRRILACWRWV